MAKTLPLDRRAASAQIRPLGRGQRCRHELEMDRTVQLTLLYAEAKV